MKVTISTPSGATILADVASTPSARSFGLMGRAGLPQGCGMLLAFGGPGFHFITMRGMSFALDLLWLDDQGRVIWSTPNAQAGYAGPLKSPVSQQPDTFVLELPAGDIQRLGLRLGDTLRF